MSETTPIEFDLDDALSKARELATQVSPDSLLKAYANLTRRMQKADDADERQQASDLRTQRGIIEAELLRRMQRPTATADKAPTLPPRRIVDAPQA